MSELISPTRRNPLRRQSSLISTSSIGSPTKLHLKRKSQIDRLLNKFLYLDRSIEVNISKANFNLIDYQLNPKKEKAKYNPQMMAEKLRRLQNKAEIDRAQMEIQNRQKRANHSHKKRKAPMESEPYKQTYQKFLNSQNLYNLPELDSDNENDPNQIPPQGILFYKQLKHHPRLLSFTKDRLEIKSKEKEIKKAHTARMIEELRNPQGKAGIRTFIDISQEIKRKQVQQQVFSTLIQNPEKIVDSQYYKFFSKKRNDRLSNQTKSLQRCNKMLERQNAIMNAIEQNAISKQNKKKLESRFNQIVNEIAKHQKAQNDKIVSNSRFTLPKLENVRNKSAKKRSMFGSTDTCY